MMLRPVCAFVLVLAACAAARGEEPPAAASSTGSAENLQLLAEIPSYAEILAHYGDEVPPAGSKAEQDWVQFGRLQDIGPGRSLTLSDSIVLALRHNTGLEVERLAPLSAAAGIGRSESVFDTTLFGEINKQRSVTPSDSAFFGGTNTPVILEQNFNANIGLRKLFRTGAAAELRWNNVRKRSNFRFQGLDPDYSSDLSLSLNQPLLRDFGFRYATILVRIAETAELQAIRSYEARAADLVKQVEQLYWRAVLAAESVRVGEEGLALARELERQNEGKFKVGSLPQTAVLEAQAEVARRESQLIRARNAAINARDALRALINYREEGSEALLAIDLVSEPGAEPYPTDLDKSLALAREHRPELKLAQLEVHAKGLALTAAENQVLPRVNAVGAIGLNGLAGKELPPATPGIGPNPYAGHYGDTLNTLVDGRFYSYLAGVTIEIPLANAQGRADYTTARIDLERARLNFQRLQQQVTLEVKTAISDVESARKNIDATRMARDLAQRNLENQQARYDVGLATTKDILDFQDRLTQARFAAIQALTDYNVSVAELRRTEGTLLSARNVVLDVAPRHKTPWWAKF